jgi:hypothetical protein
LNQMDLNMSREIKTVDQFRSYKINRESHEK